MIQVEIINDTPHSMSLSLEINTWIEEMTRDNKGRFEVKDIKLYDNNINHKGRRTAMIIYDLKEKGESLTIPAPGVGQW